MRPLNAEPTKLTPSLDDFRPLFAAGQGTVPVYAELTADYETPLSAFRKISDGANAFLFESAERTEQSGRYSILGSDPRIVFEARDKSVRVTDRGELRQFDSATDPFADLEALMAEFRPVPGAELPGFHGGAVGYLGYDTVRWFEPTVSPPPPDALGLPDMVFMVTDTVVVFDHRFRMIQVVANVFTDEHHDAEAAYEAARSAIDGTIKKLERPLHVRPMRANEGDSDEVPEPRCNTTREEYEAIVERGKEYIYAGDVFQFVPSQRFEVPFSGRAVDLYRALRHVNPSPYMFLLELGGFSLVGSSPEVHVKCLGGSVEIRPLAGTRWRGKTEEEDLALERDLLADPKECAEHIMLVDLARNDVGRVSEFASVVVSDLMTIERYSHVMHIVSNVRGTLADGRSAYDVMRATFPAGTVSGSPKVRAMQIINELEKNKRCAYAGAVGYFGFDGNHDSCIALRTCVVKDGSVYIQSGAGVVADSVPAAEYEETVNKAKAMVRAVGRAIRLGAD